MTDINSVNAVNAYKKKLREEVEGKRKKKNSIKHFGGNGYYNQQGYNQALDDVLTQLDTNSGDSIRSEEEAN
jgi:hypothetical protein